MNFFRLIRRSRAVAPTVIIAICCNYDGEWPSEMLVHTHGGKRYNMIRSPAGSSGRNNGKSKSDRLSLLVEADVKKKFKFQLFAVLNAKQANPGAAVQSQLVRLTNGKCQLALRCLTHSGKVRAIVLAREKCHSSRCLITAN